MLVAFYRQLHMGRKYTILGVKYQELLIRSHELNYKDIFVGTQIYIRYVVIYIVLITVIIAIGLFYLTQLRSFLEFFFEYLPLFIPIVLRYILDKV